MNRILPVLAILCGIAFGHQLALAEGPILADPVSSPDVEIYYIAILGEVARPGVFETTEPHLELLELVNRAGGVTTSASGNVRVIREGRAGEQTYLTTDLNYGLLPNDLVIVDSWQSWVNRPFSEKRSDGPADHESEGWAALPAPAIIQLGLVNLISRPVVLDVAPEEATLRTVLSLLHQSQRDIREVTVLKPFSGVESVSCEEAVDVPLVSGTVLVFDLMTVDAKALPPLPATVPPPTNTAPRSAVSPAPQESIPQALTRLQASTREQTNPRVGPDNTVKKVPESQTATKKKSKRGPAPKNLAKADSEKKQSQAGWAGSAILVLIVVGGLSFAGIRVRRFRTSRQAAPIVSEEASPEWDSARALKAMVSNALPIREEPVQLRKESEIFGRPRLDSPYRIDTAHTLSGPHFAVEPQKPAVENEDRQWTTREQVQETVASPVAAVREAAVRKPVVPPAPVRSRVAVLQSGDDGPARKIRIDTAHHRSSLGALDRALATFEEGRS